MPSSSVVYPHGKVRFFRLAAILHDEGKELLVLFLKTFYSGTGLRAFLDNQINKAKIDTALSKQVINHEQYSLLYPPTTTDIKLYDITLLVFLIRSLHPSIPVNHKVWKYPSPGDTSAEAAVTNLREARNKLYSHIYELNLSDVDFQAHCSYIQGVFENLASGIGDPDFTVDHVKDRIQNKIHAPIDPDSENRLLNCLQSWKQFDNQDFLIEKFEDIKEEIKSLRETVCLRKEVRSVGTCTTDDLEYSDTLQQSSDSLLSLDSDGTVYEVPISKPRISDIHKETMTETLEHCNKYNDASTSTSSLEPQITFGDKVWAILSPFLGNPTVLKPVTPKPTCHASEKKVVKKRTRQRHSPFKSLSCVRANRRYRTVSKLHLQRHEGLQLKCFLSGLVHLLNGLLVVIDSSHNVIQVYDQWRALIDEYKCRYPIKNVCAFKGDKKVAVTLFQHHSVALFEITRKDGVKYLETVNVQCSSWLIDVKYRHGKMYTMCDKSEIHVHHFRSIPDDVIRFDIGVNTLSFDVSVQDEKTYLYILHSDGVICFTDSGKEIWEHSFFERGVNYELTFLCLHSNKLFLSAWGTNRVIELTRDGEWVRNIGNGVLSNPWALTASVTGQKLFVSQYNALSRDPNTRELLIFQ